MLQPPKKTIAGKPQTLKNMLVSTPKTSNQMWLGKPQTRKENRAWHTKPKRQNRVSKPEALPQSNPYRLCPCCLAKTQTLNTDMGGRHLKRTCRRQTPHCQTLNQDPGWKDPNRRDKKTRLANETLQGEVALQTSKNPKQTLRAQLQGWFCVVVVHGFVFFNVLGSDLYC